MDQNETRWDKLLKIKTSGRDDSHSDTYHYPYEPTPYSVLERLAQSGYIKKNNTLIDYGCGKGRVDFFLAYQCKCNTIGIEYDERIYEKAVSNKENAVSAGRCSFEMISAEEYQVGDKADRFYFFNPFSVELLKSVMGRIKDAYYENPREMLLFFYYPSANYISYLMTVDELEFVDEIECDDLFEGVDLRERIMVFRMGVY